MASSRVILIGNGSLAGGLGGRGAVGWEFVAGSVGQGCGDGGGGGIERLSAAPAEGDPSLQE